MLTCFVLHFTSKHRCRNPNCEDGNDMYNFVRYQNWQCGVTLDYSSLVLDWKKKYRATSLKRLSSDCKINWIFIEQVGFVCDHIFNNWTPSLFNHWNRFPYCMGKTYSVPPTPPRQNCLIPTTVVCIYRYDQLNRIFPCKCQVSFKANTEID